MKVHEAAREGFLYQLWVNHSFRETLRSIDGHTVQILEKGIRNYDAGPDFLNALIKIDDEICRGDIEIHPLAADWYHHHHHLDPRYNQVILHIVTMHTPHGFLAFKQDGTAATTLNLDDFMDTGDECADTESYDLDRPLRPVCTLAQQPMAVRASILRQAGLIRMTVKAQRFLEMRTTHAWQQISYSALAVSLGYSKNHLPFARLAHLLPVEKLWKYIWNDPRELALNKCAAYLFGASGLLPASADNDYIKILIELWHSFPDREKITPMKPESWQFFRLRPINFPSRRIASLAELTLRFSQEGFIAPFMKMVANSKQKPRQAVREMEERLQVGRHDFWSHHYTFLDSCEGTETSLLGVERSREMAINVILPILTAYNQETESEAGIAMLRDLFSHYPRSPENEITRWMKARIFEVTERQNKNMDHALYQQGLIHLYKSVCSGAGVCQRCLDSGFTSTSS
jgi:hypothetical protein